MKENQNNGNLDDVLSDILTKKNINEDQNTNYNFRSLPMVYKIQNGITYNIDDKGFKKVTFYDNEIITEELKEEPISSARSSVNYKRASNEYVATHKFFGYKVWSAHVEADFAYDYNSAWAESVVGYYKTYNIIGGMWSVDNENYGSEKVEGGKLSRAYYRGTFHYGLEANIGGTSTGLKVQTRPVDLRVSCNYQGKIFRN